MLPLLYSGAKMLPVVGDILKGFEGERSGGAGRGARGYNSDKQRRYGPGM